MGPPAVDCNRVTQAPDPARRGALRWVAAVAACTSLFAAGPAHAADGGSAAQARDAAHAADQRMHELVPQLDQALHAYTAALQALAAGTTTQVQQARAAETAARGAMRARSEQGARVRALWVGGGGGLAYYAAILETGDPNDVSRRAHYAQAVVRAATAAQAATALADQRATGAADRADAASADLAGDAVSVSTVEDRLARVTELLTAAQLTLDHLSARAKSLTEAETARAALARARAAAAAVQAAAARAQATPRLPMTDYLRLYRGAALTCPGLSWTVLSAVGQVESGHGRNNGPSSAGAMGPMQFLPSTFAAYAVDGDSDGVADIWNPADSIFTAARYLCGNGAGTVRGVYGALWHYNHAEWYVRLVLGIAAALGGPPLSETVPPDLPVLPSPPASPSPVPASTVAAGPTP